MFATSPQFRPYLGGQMPPQALAQPPQIAQPGQQLGQPRQISPLLQQLMQNPAFLARLQQMQGTGLGGISAQQSPYGLGQMGPQPAPAGAYSLR